MGAQMKVEAIEAYDAGDILDIYSDMLDRARSIEYMLESLRGEVNSIQALTKKDSLYFVSINRCLAVIEQLSYDNVQRLVEAEEKFEEEFKNSYKALK